MPHSYYEVQVQRTVTETYWVRALSTPQARNQALVTDHNRHPADARRITNVERLHQQAQPERDKTIAEMAQRGHTSYSIAQTVGMTRRSVDRVLVRLRQS
jgi:hypothetical protein